MTENQDVVVWLDPGATTGLAWWDEDAGAFGSWQYDKGDLFARLTVMSRLYENRLQVGYEKYLITPGGPRTGTAKHSMDIIAGVDEMAKIHAFRLLQSQPSSARKLGSPVLLRRLGWYKPGKPHANDAAMHMLSYLMRQKPMSPHVRRNLFPGY